MTYKIREIHNVICSTDVENELAFEVLFGVYVLLFQEMAIVEFKDHLAVGKLLERGATTFSQYGHFTFPSHFLYFHSHAQNMPRSKQVTSAARIKRILRSPHDGEELLRSELLAAATVGQ